MQDQEARSQNETRNGYTRRHPVGIDVEAQMLETWAGYGLAQASDEFVAARKNLNAFDADSLRWLACGIERRLADLEARV